ncbi:MAG: DUF5343 domain-containing protein [Chloroflexi bacterium]|nr:DUF5343 domain-containing protein [Chloroflexota bacterium]
MDQPRPDDKKRLPPYGPASGMIQGLKLLERLTPAKIDGEYLRANKIAPGNEYKVVGALQFLGLIDEDGRPTEKCRLLKTQGPPHMLALQQIVRGAYRDLFDKISPREATREQIYNHFVADLGMGAEMASKATRFLVGLCHLAQIDLAAAPSLRPKTASRPPRKKRSRVRPAPATSSAESPTLPFVFAITAEVAEMDEEKLTEIFRKMSRALRRALSEGK